MRRLSFRQPFDNGQARPTTPPNRKGSQNMAYKIGEKPGIGRYCCMNCNWSVYLNDNSDRLPPCGNCGKGQNTLYRSC